MGMSCSLDAISVRHQGTPPNGETNPAFGLSVSHPSSGLKVSTFQHPGNKCLRTNNLHASNSCWKTFPITPILRHQINNSIGDDIEEYNNENSAINHTLEVTVPSLHT